MGNKFQTHGFWTQPRPEPEVAAGAVRPLIVTRVELRYEYPNWLAVLWPDGPEPIILGTGTQQCVAHYEAIRGLELYDIIPRWDQHGPLLENPFLDGPTKFQIMVECYAMSEKGIQL